MDAAIERLTCYRDESRPNRRKVSRATANALAILRGSGSEIVSVRLADVSIHGCATVGEAAWARTGRFVSIELDNGEALQAIVRWTREATTGFEFLRPVPTECAEWHRLIASPWGA